MKDQTKTEGNESSKSKRKPKSWLQYVTEQSWEPELLISGLAIYATLKLPALLLDAYHYYQFNLQAGSGFLDNILPLLIYCVFVVAAYVLLASFIAHFVVRAFWVGFIGLMSVYKEGISYSNLTYGKRFKDRVRKEMGPAEQMAQRLDQISSLIFSIAFLIVLMMVVIAMWYVVFFLLYNVLKLFLAAAVFEQYITIFFGVFAVVFVLYFSAVLILNLERFRSNPKMADWLFKLRWKPGAFMMPLLFRPIQFIKLIFQSNISKKRYFGSYVLFFVVFMVLLLSVELHTLAPSLFDSRSFFSAHSSTRHVELQEYNSTFEKDGFLRNATLEKPVQTSGMMQVFIPYPKKLDQQLHKICSPANVPDSLRAHIRHRRENKHRIACAQRFFSFTADDSLRLRGDLMFAQNPVTKQEGFQSYIDNEKMGFGRHTFKVTRQPISKEDSTDRQEGDLLDYETEIPFWVK